MPKTNAPKVAIVLFTSKKLKGGLHPVVMRYSFNGRSYITISNGGVDPTLWDHDSNLYLTKKSGKTIDGAEKKNDVLKSELRRAEGLISEMKRKDEPFTFERFRLQFLNLRPSAYAGLFIKERIAEIRGEGRVGTADSYNDMYNSLKRFRKGIDKLQMEDIDYSFLKKYAADLLKHGCTTNGIGVYMRSLRACYNEWYRETDSMDFNQAFRKYKIKSEKTKKRRLDMRAVRRFESFDAKPDSLLWDALNFTIFSFYMRGMNFMDIALLSYKNLYLNEGVIKFRREKTNKEMTIRITERVLRILNAYKDRRHELNGRVFPILLREYGDTQVEQSRQRGAIKSKRKRVNNALKFVANELDLDNPKEITFYTFRHSYATALRMLGKSDAVICEAMGHSSVDVTSRYLNSFGNDYLKEVDTTLMEEMELLQAVTQ
jgi:integrase/recombinase XerD